MSTKRQATTDLNHENWDKEDSNEVEEADGFKMASKEVLEKRVIRTAKRRSQVQKSSVFSGFSGFNKVEKSSFDFLANLTNGNQTNNGASTFKSDTATVSSNSVITKPESNSSSGIFSLSGNTTPIIKSAFGQPTQSTIFGGFGTTTTVTQTVLSTSKPDLTANDSPFKQSPVNSISNINLTLKSNTNLDKPVSQLSSTLFGATSSANNNNSLSSGVTTTTTNNSNSLFSGVPTINTSNSNSLFSGVPTTNVNNSNSLFSGIPMTNTNNSNSLFSGVPITSTNNSKSLFSGVSTTNANNNNSLFSGVPTTSANNSNSLFSGVSSSSKNISNSPFSGVPITSTNNNALFSGISTKNASNNISPFSNKITKSIPCNASVTNSPQSTEINKSDAKDDKKLIYYNNLMGLNKSVSDWIKKHVEETPLCILTPIFRDYEKHLKNIQDEYNKSQEQCSNLNISEMKQKTENKNTPTAENNLSSTSLSASSDSIKSSNFVFKSSPSTTVSAEKISKFSFGINTPANVSTTNSSTGGIPSTGFSFGIKSPSAVSSPFATNPTTNVNNGNSPFSFGIGKPFAFNSNINKNDEQTNEGKDNEDEPPKVEYTPIAEENSVYDKKCKVFVKKDANYIDKGVGTLYVKKIEESGKYQLLIRANTSLGNVMINMILSSSIPIQRMGKNNVMMICIPTPDAKPPPTSILIRVKTSEDAEELLNTLNKFKA